MNAISDTTIAYTRDPFDNFVTLNRFVCDVDASQKDILHLKNDIAKVIGHPAMLLETFDTSLKRYYFGAINWHHTILIGVRNINGIWILTKCFENPSGSLVYPIYRRSNQLI